MIGPQPAEDAYDCKELRASAAPGCGPHGLYKAEIQN